MHRNKDVILGEDAYTNRCDNAPRNIFSLTGFVLKILKSVSPSPTRPIERFQDSNPPVLGVSLNCPDSANPDSHRDRSSDGLFQAAKSEFPYLEV